MAKKILLSLAAIAAFAAAGCSEKTIEYNSNSGVNGSRDSASQLLIDTSYTEDISAPKGDNEDWYYFVPPEEGFIGVRVFIDHPQSLIATITIRDSFGKPVNSMQTNHSENTYEFEKFEVKPERYFVSLITTDGESNYTLRADFELPPPPVVIEDPVVETPSSTRPRKPSGGSTQPAPEPDTAKPTIAGTIVLVTPRGENLSEIKINGIGKNKGVKAGAKAYLRGLNRKVDLYKCLNTSCTGTVKATSEELTHYDKVDVEVE